MASFLTSQLDYIFFFYGLAFMCVGLSAIALREAIPRAPWVCLALFGFAHGATEWLDLALFLGMLGGQNLPLRLSLLFISFFFLFEFGRRALNFWNGLHLKPWLTALACLPPLLALAFDPDLFRIATRYSLGFGGAILAAIALWPRRETVPRSTRPRAGIPLLLYGIAAGLFPGTAPFFPANIINTEAFLRATNIPIQLIRGVLALHIAFVLWGFVLRSTRGNVLGLARPTLFSRLSLGGAIPAITGLLLGGWFFTNFVGSWQEGLFSKRLLALAGTAAASVQSEKHPQLSALLHMNPGFHQAYLAVLKNGMVSIELSAGREASSDFGNNLESANRLRSQIAQVFRDEKPAVHYLKPTSGFATILTPIRLAGPSGNESVAAVFGLDVDISHIQHAVAMLRLGAILLSLLLSIILIFYFGTVYRLERAATKVKSSELRFRDIALSSADMIWETDEALVYTYCSDSMNNVLGYTREQLLGVSALSHMPPETVALVARTIESLRGQPDAVGEYEGEYLHASGKRIILRVRGLQIFNHEGRAIGFRGTAKDVTMSKAAEAELLRTSSLYRATIEATHDGLLVVNTMGQVLHYNRRFLELWGLTDSALSEENAQKSLGMVRSLLKTPEIFDRELAAQRIADSPPSYCVLELKDGRTLERFANPQLLDGKGVARVIIYRDVTDRLKMEREKDEMQKSLFLTSKLASIGELAAGVAHEINNPLSIVKGYNSVLADEFQKLGSAPRVFEILGKQDRAVDRIVGIVNGLRTYARSDTEHFESVDLHSVIRDTIGLIEHIYQKTGIKVEADLAAPHPIVRGNIGKLQQVLMNLVSNAKDAIEQRPGGAADQGKIRISTRTVGEQLVMAVTDNGAGMPPEVQERMFDAFYTTKPPGKGTGLGLAISHSVVTAMGGRLAANSRVGEGTAMQVFLPILSKPNLEDLSKSVDQVVARKKILGLALIVDDEPEIVSLLSSYLRSFGLQVHSASDGQEALQKASVEAYDYIVTDLKMPRLDGQKLVESLRRLENTAESTILIMTGGIITDYSREQRDSIRNLADGYLKKPFSREKLYQLLVENRRRLP